MEKDLEIMAQIMFQREREINIDEAPALTSEIKQLAQAKRFTFDVIETPVDPLR